MPNIIPKNFYGTTTTSVISTATDIADGNFSGAPAAEYDNTNDATLPNAPMASVVASFPDWGGAPSAGAVVELWGVKKDTDGTSDDTDAPSGTASNGAKWLGSFVIAPVDALQRRTIEIDMTGVKKMDFYIRNRSGQNMNNDAGTSCVVKVTPLSVGVAV